MWNTLSDVYVCGSMWTHVIWYVLYMYYRYKKVKKCFTDQNMLNTVNTKSSHSILSFNKPSLRLLLITQDNETWGGGWAEAQSNCNIRIKQHEWHAASVWLRRVKRATRWLSSFLFTGLMCPVRQSQSRHFVSGCHIKLCSARSVTGDCLCVRMCVCVKPPWVYFRCFLNAVSCCRGKQGWQSSGSALISPSQEGHHSPFLPLPPTCTHTHKKKTTQHTHKHAYVFVQSGHAHIATGGGSLSSWFSCI